MKEYGTWPSTWECPVFLLLIITCQVGLIKTKTKTKITPTVKLHSDK